MKSKSILFISTLFIAFLLTSCGGNSELKKDAKNIADAMCKNIETMNKLRSVAPSDSVMLEKLQNEAKQAQVEMTVLYQEFQAKYKDKVNDEKFNKEFAKYLRTAMLDCPHLSKEDRANFETEMKK